MIISLVGTRVEPHSVGPRQNCTNMQNLRLLGRERPIHAALWEIFFVALIAEILPKQYISWNSMSLVVAKRVSHTRLRALIMMGQGKHRTMLESGLITSRCAAISFEST